VGIPGIIPFIPWDCRSFGRVADLDMACSLYRYIGWWALGGAHKVSYRFERRGVP